MGENGNTPQETRIVKAIERSRIGICFVAMFLGHSDYFRTFAALTVFSLAGLTAAESLLFGDASARIKNWPVGTPYQAQSACNNAALALVTLVILAMPATERTDAALATTTACTLLFILLSGVNPVPRQGRLDPQEALLRRREPRRLGRRGPLQVGRLLNE